MLVARGEMKQVVYHGHYDHDPVRGNPRTGWVYVETIRDFSSAMPAPVQAKAEVLMQSWQTHWEGLGTHDADADAVTDAVDDCRTAVVETIRTLRYRRAAAWPSPEVAPVTRAIECPMGGSVAKGEG